MSSSELTAGVCCPRCHQYTTHRQGTPPRYCATCGHALPVSAGTVEHRFKPSAPPAAVAALVLGIVALIVPLCAPAGIVAIALGASVRGREDIQRGERAGGALATWGIALGLVATAIWLFVCLGVL